MGRVNDEAVINVPDRIVAQRQSGPGRVDPVRRFTVPVTCAPGRAIACGFDPQVVSQVIFAVDRNEYKRRQSPPGVKITPRAFGKDRRLPIVNRYRQE